MTASDKALEQAHPPAFGPVLRRLRAEADLTQEVLAERAGVSVRLVSDLERGLIGRTRRHTADHLADGLSLAGRERDDFIALARGMQPAGGDAPAAAPPLPRPATVFVGREADVAAITALLLRNHARLVTLTGPGGVGKTRLAIETAVNAGVSFPDGVHFVDLASLRDPALVLPTIAQALGVPTSGARPLAERLAAWIGLRRLLVVLDNVEQVAAAAPAVAALLGTCPRLAMLATSREPLRVGAEYDYAVAPLPLPPATPTLTLDELGAIPSVGLFVQRAGATNRDFALTPANAATVAGIVHRPDGLPLAIELAAARARVLPPEALLARLEHRLPLLTGGARDLPERQQAMRTTIDWSYNLLNPGEQRLFRQLSVFAGGFTEDAAAAVSACSATEGCDTLPLLAALVEKSLVRLEDSDGAEARYAMLQVIGEYGQERLATAGEEAATRQRHALWCLQFAERSGPQLRDRDQAAWLRRLEIEHDNFRAALRWALDQQDAELAARLATALRRFWVLRGHAQEARRCLEQALAIGDDLTPPTRAGALMAVGVVAYRQGDYARTSALDEALACYRALDDTTGIAATLANLGMVAQAQGESSRATVLIEESLALFRLLGEPARIANQLESLGRVTFDRGDHEQAQTLLEDALALARETGNWHSAAFSLNGLARIAHALGDIERAIALQDEGLELWQALGNHEGIADCFENYAVFAMSQAQPTRAMRLLGAAEAIRVHIGAPGRLIDRHRRERLLQEARYLLNDTGLSRAREKGRAMPLDEAIDLALARQRPRD